VCVCLRGRCEHILYSATTRSNHLLPNKNRLHGFINFANYIGERSPTRSLVGINYL